MKRFLLSLLLFILAPLQALAALSVDGPATSTTISANVVTGSITTTKTNDVIVIQAIASSTCSGTSTVSDTAALVWTKRISESVTGQCAEEWYAVSPAILTGDSITYTFNTGMSAARLIVFGVNGANLSAPFDSNLSLPAGNNGAGVSALSSTISTNNANTLIISVMRGSGTLGTLTPPSGATQLIATGTVTESYYQMETVTLNSASYGYSWINSVSAVLIVDAIQAPVGTGIVDVY